MRVLVGDLFGRCRFIDAWNNEIQSIVGGDVENRCDRAWSAEAMCSYDDLTRSCIIHSSGYASFLSIDRTTRNSVRKLCPPAAAKSVRCEGDHFIATFSGHCVSFNPNSVIGSFKTVDCSCACSYGDQAAFGRIGDRTLIYDINTQDVKWTAAEPPFDEYKIQLGDNDTSVMFSDENTLIVGQQESTVLVYDIRSDKAVIRSHLRKVDKIFTDLPISAIGQMDENRFIFGDSGGCLLMMDMNMPCGRMDAVRGFKGSVGGILQIEKHPMLPVFGVLSCNRIFSLYDLNNSMKRPMKETFVKNLSKCFMFTSDGIPEEKSDSDDEWEKLDEGDASLWDNFVACPQAKKVKKGKK